MSAYALQGPFLFLPPSASPSTPNDVDKLLPKSSVVNDAFSSKDEADILISIKSATIDPMRLIQFIGASRRNSPIDEQSRCKNNDSLSMDFRLKDSNLSTSSICVHDTDNSSNDYASLANTNRSISSNDTDESWGEYDERPQKLTTNQQGSACLESSPPHLLPSASTCHSHKDPKNADADDTNGGIKLHDGDGGSIATALIKPKNGRSSKTRCKTKNHDDDALRFNIGVTLNGRKYTVTRALPSFVKLRHDVMAEMSDCKLNTQKISYNNVSQYGRSQIDHALSDGDLLIPDLPIGRRVSVSKDGIFDDLENRARAVVGFAGRGFSRLQAALCSYCPEMEEWLRAVTMLVPTSPSLANFLWEPTEVNIQSENSLINGGKQLSAGIVTKVSGRTTMQKNNSVATLDAITESDNDDS